MPLPSLTADGLPRRLGRLEKGRRPSNGGVRAAPGPGGLGCPCTPLPPSHPAPRLRGVGDNPLCNLGEHYPGRTPEAPSPLSTAPCLPQITPCPAPPCACFSVLGSLKLPREPEMRVGIEASYLLEPHKSGVETYTLNLLRALLASPGRPEIFLYAAAAKGPGADAQALFGKAKRVRWSRWRRLWLRLRLPPLLWADRIQVAHFPGTILPPWLPCPAVITFYDLAALRLPHLYPPRELRLYERLIPRAAQRAAAILAISESTKRDLVELLGVAAEKIFVTPLGVAPQFAPVPKAGELVARRFGLPQPYLLACVGSGHPRKNLRAVVEAFGKLPLRDLRLAIVGCAARDPRALAAIEASPARDRIVLLGHVREQDLPALYTAATLLCFPSLYEGFGLPVLEAMACGTPVICARTSSLPEVAGQAAVFVEPCDVEALAAAMEALLGDAPRRQELASAGLARARQFSWARTAQLTLAAYCAAAEA
jgi:glycosyltransferase involved in cell wall biosynthesis